MDDAEERKAELEQMIKEAEEAEAANRPPPPQPDPKDDSSLKQVDLSTDPGRSLRIAGIATMGGGGAIAITGLGLTVFYALKGREFGENLRIDNNTFTNDCTDMPVMENTPCGDLDARIDFWRVNGRKANNLAVVFGSVFGGLGAVALIAGGLVFNEGNKRTKQWEKATRYSLITPPGGSWKLRLLPAPNGIVLTGRF
jgi:hypothetical protein